MMTLKKVMETVNGKCVCCEEGLEQEIACGFASDLMSDVLTIIEDEVLLITGLSNNQTIRTAEMSDIFAILLVRNKKPTSAMLEMATGLGITIITTEYSMFKASGLLYAAGLPPIY